MIVGVVWVLFVIGLLVVATGIVAPVVVHRCRMRVAREHTEGNVMVCDRMRAQLRRHPEMGHVMRAETMPGWVWVSMTHWPPDPTVVATGWRPTRRSARSALRRYRSHAASPRR